MKGKRLLAGIVTAVMCLTLNGFKSVHADTKTEKTSYTIEDLRNLQDFLLARETPDLRGKDYDLNDDGVWDVFDLCLMRRECLKSMHQSKTLVVYYSLVLPDGTDASASASRVIVDGEPYGTTEYMAKVIQEETGADLFEIQTVQEYPTEYRDVTNQASDEKESGFRPELAAHIDNIDQYDTIFVGYPNWWGDMPMALYSFFDEYDLSGKTIIPFNSHGGSGFSQTVQSIAELEPNAEVSTEGLSLSRGTVSTSRDVIAEWIANLGYQKNNEDDSPKNLVAYYSASGTTKRIADYIAEEMNADVFVITPVNEYTDADLDWTDSNSRVVQEHNDLSNVHVELVQTAPNNFDTYDNIFIGYPIWWQEASWVVNDFVTENDFTGKNVIPFCTSMSSPLGESGTKLETMADTGNWLDGIRFTSRSSEEDVKKWAKGLDLTKPVTSNKTLIAYLSYPLPDGTDANTSASRVIVDGELYGSVEYMAKIIEKNTDADVFEIQPLESYGNDFGTVADRALNEQENGVLPELLNHIENLDQYDTIFVGYPVWWYDMPQMMYSFFEEYDFSGKTIIPFNSHGGSGFSGSVQEIAELEPNANVRTDGLTISRTVMASSEENIVNWLDKIGMKKVS
ncbi:MAG: flavodoxin [Ruminococcus sp.]|nr:flavodoxin [Ruminococcus sp.]